MLLDTLLLLEEDIDELLLLPPLPDPQADKYKRLNISVDFFIERIPVYGLAEARAASSEMKGSL